MVLDLEVRLKYLYLGMAYSAWNRTGDYIHDDKAFIFNLDTNKKAMSI